MVNDPEMRESPIDPSLPCRDSQLMVSCVDDAGLASPKRPVAEDFAKELKDLGFDLEIQDESSECLGMGIRRLPGRSRHVMRKGLIREIPTAACTENCSPNWCPVKRLALGSNSDGEPSSDWFSDSSVSSNF